MKNRTDKKMKLNVSPAFWIAATVVLIVILIALIFSTRFENDTGIIRKGISRYFGWFYLLTITFLVGVSFYLILSPAGKIRLEDPGSHPEYSTFSWIAMLFSAGMGIGLVFYGAAEPLSHYAIQAPEAAVFSQEALHDAFKYSFLHYGIHAWAIYAIVALALAYFQFRKKEKTLLSVTLKPLFGKTVEGKAGYIIDSLTIFATVIGVATSLGTGAMQINSGLNYVFGIPENFVIQSVIITLATVLFISSSLSGLNKGVKILSNTNMIIAGVLMAVVFIIGPGIRILNTFTEITGEYIQDFLRMSMRTGAGNPSQQEWINNWTMFYWSWWLAWSPFVGVFIARISKGRTIREFVSCVLLVPTLLSFIWFSVFGCLSANAVELVPSIVEMPIDKILFVSFEQFPLSGLLSVIAVILVFSFFITSADSATFVLAMQSEKGSLQPENKTKTIWGIAVSLIAAVLLHAGGLLALQNVLIIVALPFAFLLLLVTVSLLKELHYERTKMGLFLKPKRYPEKDSPFRSYEEDEEDDDL